jgi:Zn-dependent protease with chaperone function
VVAFTYFSPLALTGRIALYRRPQLGITLWLGLFAVSVIAAIAALGVAVASIFQTWFSLHRQSLRPDDLVSVLVSSFMPWVALAVGGILISLVNMRIEPLLDKQKAPNLNLSGGLPVDTCEGFDVFELPVDVAFIGAAAKDRAIIRTRGARTALTPKELEACQRHEAAHLRLRHARVLSFANLTNRLLGVFSASRAMLRELSVLIELVADKNAKDPVSLTRALAKLDPGLSDETVIRKRLLDYQIDGAV